MESSLGRAFDRLLFAAGSSNLADGVARVLLPLAALALGAPPSGVAAVTVGSTLAWPLFGLHAGWLVDRVDRYRLLRAANFLRGLMFATVSVCFATETLVLATIFIAALIFGLCETIADTALTAAIPGVVAPQSYGRANARVEGLITATELVGPSLAGLLAGATLALPAGTSAGLYLAAPLVLVGMTSSARAARRRVDQSDPESPMAPAAGVMTGLRFIHGQPLLRSLVLFTAGMNIVWAGATALMVVYVVTPGPLELSAAGYGLLVTGMAAGGVVASFLTDALRRWIGDSRLLMADCLGTVLLVLPVALGADVGFVAAGAILAGAGSSVWRIITATIRQLLTPDALLGRVYAATRVISWGVIPVSAGAAGLAADVWGIRPVFVALTAIAAAVALAFMPFAAGAGAVAQQGRPHPHPAPASDPDVDEHAR